MTEEQATYATAEGKMRAALKSARDEIKSYTEPFVGGLTAEEILESEAIMILKSEAIIQQADDALAMGTDDIRARTQELHTHAAPDLKIDLLKELDEKIDDMKSFIVLQSGGHIRTQLNQLPEQIQEQALIVSDLTADIEKLRLSIANIKNQKLELVLSATNDGKPLYSNDKARNMATEQLLREDKLYLDNCDELGRKESELRREQIQLDFLHNQFSAYRAIAGMTGVR